MFQVLQGKPKMLLGPEKIYIPTGKFWVFCVVSSQLGKPGKPPKEGAKEEFCLFIYYSEFKIVVSGFGSYYSCYSFVLSP